VAVDEEGDAEARLGAGDEAAQRGMVGFVDALDALEPLGHLERPRVDLLGIGDDPRDRAEAAGDAHRAGVDVARQPAGEHPGVELVGLAVDVEIGAREVRPHQRRSLRHDAGEQPVDEGVLGAADGVGVEPRGGEEAARIAAAGVRRVEDERRPLGGRLQHLEGGARQEVVDDVHRAAALVVRRIGGALAGESAKSAGSLSMPTGGGVPSPVLYPHGVSFVVKGGGVPRLRVGAGEASARKVARR